MLTGYYPRDFPLKHDPVRVILDNDPVPIRRRNRAIRKELAEIIDLALIDNNELHFKNASELKKALLSVFTCTTGLLSMEDFLRQYIGCDYLRIKEML